MSVRNAEILLVAVITARSTSFLFTKLLLRTMDPFNLMGIRFLIAFFILALIFWKRMVKIDRDSLFGGIKVGIVFFVVMAFEFHALRYTESMTTSFIENTAIVLVPLFEAAIAKKLPSRPVLAGSLLAIGGVGLLSFRTGSFSLGIGEVFAAGSAVTYAAAIMVTARVSKKGDSLVLGIVQLGTIGVLGTAASFLTESPVLPQRPIEWGFLLMLALCCSGFGFTLQPVAQRYVSSEKAGLFCAVSPVASGILGWVFLGENLGAIGITGAVMVIASIFLEGLMEKREKERRQNAVSASSVTGRRRFA
ncbi:MAG: DMT family transporter [Anaerovoracaceae bacterium]|jgi:drug/metabolite transporter (DMT)-like permease